MPLLTDVAVSEINGLNLTHECGLQRRVTESEEEIQQQRREMEAGFLVQTQQLEAKYKQDASNAIQARPSVREYFCSFRIFNV